MPETIADFIKSDLQALIREKREIEETLTLEALASRYNVSTTPVRQAVQELIEDEILLKQENGRLGVHPRLNRKPVSPKAMPKPPPFLPDPFKIEELLTEEIVRLSLKGAVSFLREETTSERFGIGRTVLRQVFNRLAGKGLLEHVPRRGWRVHPYNEKEMLAYLDVRVSLELKALDLARPYLIQADLERMLRGNKPTPGTQDERLDNDLHQYLVEKSGNRYIKTFFEQHGAYHTHLFAFAAPSAKVVKAMAGQHRAILRALIDKDWRKARRALAYHIRSQSPIVRRLFKIVRRES
jgi:DNA-binding GntR family transcriptional regulator